MGLGVAVTYDAPQWIRFDVPGVGRIDVTEPMTAGGVYRSVTMAELGQLAQEFGGAPLTAAIADAVWASAATKISPTLMSAATETDSDEASSEFTQRLLSDPAMRGPAYVDVGAKDWVLDELDATTATNYGLRGASGSVVQPIRVNGDPRRHNWGHRDWSQLARLWRAPGGGQAMASIAESLGASPFGVQMVRDRWHGSVSLPDAPVGGSLAMGVSGKKRLIALAAAGLILAYALGWLG